MNPLSAFYAEITQLASTSITTGWATAAFMRRGHDKVRNPETMIEVRTTVPCWRRTTVGAIAVAIALASSLMPAAPASAAPADLTFTVNQGEMAGQLVGVTQGWTVIDVIDPRSDRYDDPYASNDGGKTWKKLSLGTSDDISLVASGYAYSTDWSSVVKATPLAGGTTLDYSTQVSDRVRVAKGTRVAVEGKVVDMTDGRTLQTGLSDVIGIADAGVIDRSINWAEDQTLTLRPWDGAACTLAVLRDSEVEDVHVVGEQLRVLRRLPTQWQYCTMALTASNLSCRKIADSAASNGHGRLGGNETAAVASFSSASGDNGQAVIIEDTAITLLAPPFKGAEIVPFKSDGGGRPQVTTRTHRIAYAVSASGTTTKTVTYPIGPVETEILGLTPGRVVFQDDSDAPGTEGVANWSRSIGSTVGTQTKLPVRSTSGSMTLNGSAGSISGRRTAVTTLNGIATMDGSTVTKQGIYADQQHVSITRVSGPYLLAHTNGNSQVLDATGKELGIGGNDLFGSRVVATEASNQVTVTDVAKSTTPFKSLSVTAGRHIESGPYIYGDWVGWAEEDDEGRRSVVVHNLVSGAKLTRQGYLNGLGDGFATISGERTGWWRFSDNKVVYVPFFRAHDGVNRTAFVDGDKVRISTLDGFGTSAARVLGILAPTTLDVSKGATWTPEIDASKGIAAGTIEIRDGSNQVVRNLTTPASATGSVRNVGWDGRDAARAAVANGTYTWTFTANSTDGTGAVKAVDGTSAVMGTITVSGVGAGSGFLDVPPGTAHYDHIVWLANQGISTGWTVSEGKEFRPLRPVNRDAMAAFMYRLAGSPAYTPPTTSPFTDVTPTTAFYKEISWLASKGISTGWAVSGGKEYRPLEPVNRDAMAAFLYRLYGKPVFTAPNTSPFQDIAPSTAFYKEMAWLASNGISTGWPVSGGAEFRPVQPVNRDAMAAFMHRSYDMWGTPTL